MVRPTAPPPASTQMSLLRTLLRIRRVRCRLIGTDFEVGVDVVVSRHKSPQDQASLLLLLVLVEVRQHRQHSLLKAVEGKP